MTMNSTSIPSDAEIAAFLCQVVEKGILIKGSNGTKTIHAPITFEPSSFPKELFHEASDSIHTFNLMIDRLARSEEFLEILKNHLSSSDPFMNSLFQVHEEAKNEPHKSKIIAGINRNDFLQHKADNRIYQVELNTFSCSFLGLSQKVSEVMKEKIACPEEFAPNASLDNAVELIGKILKTYNQEYHLHQSSSKANCVLFVCQPEESNIYDQSFLSETLKGKLGIEVIRATFTELSQGALHLERSVENGALFLDGKEIAAVYFRAGYAPADYPSELEWKVRLEMEKSRAVKIPNVEYQLIGKKTVQFLLKDQKLFQKFFPETEFSEIPRFFTGIYSLDDEIALERLRANPELFVLKPQRDGGGNNVFGKDILDKMKEKDFAKAAYILMDIISSPTTLNTLLRSGESNSIKKNVEVISELGIYGGFVRLVVGDGRVVANENLGYLLRTKEASSKESGVVAGFGYLDAPRLTTKE